jgi:hypothetical protein
MRSLIVPPSATRAALDLAIGLSNGDEKVVIRQRLIVPLRGAARLTPGGWVAMSERTKFTVDEARREPIRVRPVGGAILDGDVWVRTPMDRPKPVGECHGLGERLTWRSTGAYDIAATPMVLAGEVTDHGLVHDVRTGADSCRWEIELSGPNEPDSESRVVWWDGGGRYAAWQPDQLQESASVWRFAVPEGFTAPAVVAVARAGSWLGVWWHDEWSEVLKSAAKTFGSRTTAQLVRWFRLPVLARRAVGPVRKFAIAHPLETLTAWLFDDPPAGLRWPARADGWLPAVASTFRSWMPTKDQANNLLQTFASATAGLSPDDELPIEVRLALQLARLDPLLMARFVRSIQSGTQEPFAAVVGYLLAARANATGRDGFDQTLIDEAVRAFRWESTGSGPSDNERWADQLAVRIARDEPFRLQLAIRLLDSLSASRQG